MYNKPGEDGDHRRGVEDDESDVGCEYEPAVEYVYFESAFSVLGWLAGGCECGEGEE